MLQKPMIKTMHLTISKIICMKSVKTQGHKYFTTVDFFIILASQVEKLQSFVIIANFFTITSRVFIRHRGSKNYPATTRNSPDKF